MEITETKISVINKPNSRLRAYASITFDNAFVIREIRIIEGKEGLFVAMPSRKLQRPCGKCGFKNPINHKFCGQCGGGISFKEEAPASRLPGSQQHKDLAHPINTQFREYLQQKILEAYGQQKTAVPEIKI